MQLAAKPSVASASQCVRQPLAADRFSAAVNLSFARHHDGLWRPNRRLAVALAATGDGSKGFGKQEKPEPKGKKATGGKGPAAPAQSDALRSIATNDAPDVISPASSPSRATSATRDDDRLFEERLREVRRAAEERKRAEAGTSSARIDYDAPQPSPLPSASSLAKDLPAKIAIGVAATVFAAIFAFGDILPAPAPPSQVQQQQQASGGLRTAMSDDQRSRMEAQLQEVEARLVASPGDRESLEASAVLYAELEQFEKAAERLDRLVKVAPEDGEAHRLLGEVRYELGDYAASAKAYRTAVKLAPSESVELLQGLTSALLADKQPQKAVDELLAARMRVAEAPSAVGSADLVQVELLLGKAYVAWGKPGDAASVYDALIASQPDDFRGYLAKGILLKDTGKNAEKMFLQARYLAPDQVKPLVERMAAR